MAEFAVNVELRKVALELANKAYRTGGINTSPGSVGGTLSTTEVVERAKAYYDFLKGEQNG